MPAQLPGKAAGLDSENDHRLLRPAYSEATRRPPRWHLCEVLAVTSSFLKRDPTVGRRSIEESAWFELMMPSHEVFLSIKLAAPKASGEADL